MAESVLGFRLAPPTVLHNGKAALPISLGFIAARALDRALQVIGHQECRHSTHEFEGAKVRADPVGQRLRPTRLGIGVVRCAEHGDEDLGWAQLPGSGIDNRHGLAAIVEKELFAGKVHLAHGALAAPGDATGLAGAGGGVCGVVVGRIELRN